MIISQKNFESQYLIRFLTGIDRQSQIFLHILLPTYKNYI